MNIEFDGQPVYSDSNKYIKAKTKSYGDTNFQGKRTSKENSSNKSLSLVMIDSVIRIS